MVNTFLPYADFEETASCLDMRRLGKQRVEAKQIINCLEDENSKGWKNHPAVKMWKGYVPALKHYYNIIVSEWIGQGYKNTLKFYDINIDDVEMPWWIDNEDFHRSHQASLVRKNKEHYEYIFADLSNEYLERGYVWPKIIDGKEVIEFSPISKK